MDVTIEKLTEGLTYCRDIIRKGYTRTTSTEIAWLNNFCAEFLRFSNRLHKYIDIDVDSTTERNEAAETIFLCLTQIITCVRHMERTIKAEQPEGVALSSSRQHFIDRIVWCMDSIQSALNTMAKHQQSGPIKEGYNVVQLMDRALDYLAPYSSYKDFNVPNIAEENAEAIFASKQIRSTIDHFLSDTLAFANVALKSDKKAISALCQKVLRECIAFQNECSINEREVKINKSNRKLKAMSLENALTQLEDYINDALLRLVFATFLDYSKFSIEKLRVVMQLVDADDTQLDELIADFDVNVDRTTQIGIFAIAFAPNVKVKTIVRSCLASLESLDSCVIPSLQSNCNLHSEILEQHFNEEVAKFKLVIQEIIDSHAFCACYNEMLSDHIVQVDKHFNKDLLLDVLQMGLFLQEHFQIKVNYVEICKEADRKEYFEKFTLMLRECQAILMCADQVEKSRILKRFKILRSVVRKLLDSLAGDSIKARKSQLDVFITSDEAADSNQLFESEGILPSYQSILYNSDTAYRRRATSDSLKGNCSKIPIDSVLLSNASSEVGTNSDSNSAKYLSLKHVDHLQQRRISVRRKESLRTAMFKRQKSTETENVYKIYKESCSSLQITDILDQLTGLSSKFSNASLSDETNE